MKTPPRIVVVGLAIALLQFGLAILGWGGWTPFFAHRALVALACVTVALMIVTPFTSGNASPGIREDRGNRWVLAGLRDPDGHRNQT
jgi:hypothetical protein